MSWFYSVQSYKNKYRSIHILFTFILTVLCKSELKRNTHKVHRASNLLNASWGQIVLHLLVLEDILSVVGSVKHKTINWNLSLKCKINLKNFNNMNFTYIKRLYCKYRRQYKNTHDWRLQCVSIPVFQHIWSCVRISI